MFNGMMKKQTAVMLGFAATAVLLSACTTASTSYNPGTKGMVPLDSIKVGIPETVVQNGILTFVPDPAGTVGQKTQYLSRGYDANGGQYIVQAMEGRCFGVQVYHLQKPIPKETALTTMKNLFPATLPPQSGVDNSQMKGAEPKEVYSFGDSFKGELVYADKNGTEVKMVNAWTTPTITPTAQ
jgi:hypothetical protein